MRRLVKTCQDLVDLLLTIRNPGILRAVQYVFLFAAVFLLDHIRQLVASLDGVGVSQHGHRARNAELDVPQHLLDARQALSGNILEVARFKDGVRDVEDSCLHSAVIFNREVFNILGDRKNGIGGILRDGANIVDLLGEIDERWPVFIKITQRRKRFCYSCVCRKRFRFSGVRRDGLSAILRRLHETAVQRADDAFNDFRELGGG